MNNKMVHGKVIVRDATEDDICQVAEMVQELANYENMPNAPKITAKGHFHLELRRDGFGSDRQFRCKVAEVQATGALIGFAVHYPTYSTRQGKAMLLKNLFVKEKYRRGGVGQMLFCAICTEAVAGGCARLDWHVLRWNAARAFYGRLGAQDLTQRLGALCYSLSGDAFRSLAARPSAA